MNFYKFHNTVPLTSKLLFRNDEHALVISSLLEAIFLHGYQEHGVKVRETFLRFRVNKYTPKALCPVIHHFRNEKGSGTQMLPAIVSAIVTVDTPVSYWQCFTGRPVARLKDYSFLIYCYLFIFEFLHTRGDTQQNYIQESSFPRSSPLLFSVPVLSEKGPLLNTFK